METCSIYMAGRYYYLTLETCSSKSASNSKFDDGMKNLIIFIIIEHVQLAVQALFASCNDANYFRKFFPLLPVYS